MAMIHRLKNFFWGSMAFFLVVPFGLVQAEEGILIITPEIPSEPTLTTELVKLDNPLSNITSLPELIDKILLAFIQIGVPVAALFIVYSGFLFVFARGNEEKLKMAKTVLTYTLIGTAVLLGAQVISSVIGGTLDQVLKP